MKFAFRLEDTAVHGLGAYVELGGKKRYCKGTGGPILTNNGCQNDWKP